ncbi:ribonuclease H-like domain-containing protein [Tanacetum coccineum]
MKVEELLNVTFDEIPPPTKLSPLVDDDVGEEEAIENNTKLENNNNVEDESIEVDEIVNIKEFKNHPLEQVYRNTLDENGIVSRNKARLVAQGYNQQEGIDYDETYAPVARLESIRILLTIACANDFRLYQMDVKSAFLNGFINEEVYIAQPPRFIDFEKPNYVYKLKKALYGLKQDPKAWYGYSSVEGDLRKFSDIGAWVHVPRCIAWLDYDEHVDSLSTMDNEVEVSSPESTTQILSLFKEYTPPVTYPEEVEKTLETPIEVEPLNETKLEEVGLNCNHNTPLSSREVPSFDKPEPQPQPLPNCPPLDVSLGEERGPKPPIKLHSLNSFRMKEVDSLTTNTPPSSHVATFHPKDTYCYDHPCIVDPKKHYRFKPGLLGKSVSLGVDISNWEIFDDDWGLESKEVSPLGEELSLFDRLNEVKRGKILEAHRLEPGQ